MKIFNQDLLATYEYRPLPQNHESSPPIFNITDTVSLAVSPTAALEAASEASPTTPPSDNSGIQTMLTEMLMESDPSLDPTKVEALTESLDLHRLENIIHLSQQGDGWDKTAASEAIKENVGHLLNPTVNRREAVKMIAAGLLAGFTFLGAAYLPSQSSEQEAGSLKWDEYFKGNYRLMSDEEKAQTVERLEKLYEMRTGNAVTISTADAIPGVLYGYAFNVSKCRGYMDCIRGCLAENNQDRATDMRYIRIHEHQQGQMNFDEAVDDYYHEVPADDHYYIGTQCFHCENAPCVPVCPVKATWKEEDGIVVVDYDWCIGCRYCIAACPYDARRFNWADPVVPQEEINHNQHYLGNRLRKQGVTEKCTFCIQRTRQGKNPACVEACPTGARIFGNLLDPNSEIRWVLKNKKVFRLKEDLGTEPKFWYFTD